MNNEKLICAICGAEFSTTGGHPLKKHGITNKEYYDTYLKKEGEGICKSCGKPTKFLGITKGYSKYCSTKCSNSSDEVKNKRKISCIDKYGTTTPLLNSKVQEKIKQTKLEKYGDENYSNREKAKQTNLERYGVEYNFASNDSKLNGSYSFKEKYGVDKPFQSKKIQHQIKETVQQKYGVDNVFQSEQIKDKIKQTNLNKYGVEYPTQSPEILDKRVQNNIEKYGVDSPSKLDSVKEKSRKTCYEKYNVPYYLQSDELKEHAKQVAQVRYNVPNFSSAPEIKDKIKQTNLNKYGVPWYCMTEDCRKANSGNNSKPNLNFEQLLIEKGIKDYSREFSLAEYSYDFKVDNILIEINPYATHNVNWTPWNKERGTEKYYHYNKSKIAEYSGYRCIQIWDWDDINKVINMLFQNDKLYARKCDIKVVNKQDEKVFLNTYHLQNYVKSQIALGLYYNDELVSLMTFGKPRYNKKYEYELLRYCSCKNIVGGAEKLFKYFIKHYNPESIISYCDRSKFKGDVYLKLGFKKLGSSSISCHWYNGHKHITDNLLRQRGFDQLFHTNYGKGSSNKELMLAHGFVQIYDCGQDTFIWSNNE